jgi:hypothetical protein
MSDPSTTDSSDRMTDVSSLGARVTEDAGSNDPDEKGANEGVGTCDGTALAWVLGRKDGKPVGLVETSTLGPILPVEDTMGAGGSSRLGLSLGANDGDADGDRDGSELIEGNTDCTGVGFPDGTELGLAVGPSVGLRVGNRFGTAGRLLLLGIALGETNKGYRRSHGRTDLQKIDNDDKQLKSEVGPCIGFEHLIANRLRLHMVDRHISMVIYRFTI